METKRIVVRVSRHPGGNLTLVERLVGTNEWKDAKEKYLSANLDATSFYRTLAQRLATHAKNGTLVENYVDFDQIPEG